MKNKFLKWQRKHSWIIRGEHCIRVWCCNVSVKGVILKHRDPSQQRMERGLFHFLPLFMTQPDADGVWRMERSCQPAAVDTLCTGACTCFQKPSLNLRQINYTNMTLFEKKSYSQEKTRVGKSNTTFRLHRSPLMDGLPFKLHRHDL